MSSISATSQTTSSNGIDQSLYTDSKDRSSLSQQDFMGLFLKELQYQDPMQPMDTGQMATQMAQLNQVDLMYKNNQAIENMLKATQDQSKAQAVQYIGQNVMYPGNNAMVQDGEVKPFEIELMKDATSLKVSIYNEKGTLVNEVSTGAMQTGKTPLGWDGTDKNGQKVADGNYKVIVQAADKEGNSVEVKNWTTGAVNGVTYDNGATKLTLKDGTEIALEDVWKIGN